MLWPQIVALGHDDGFEPIIAMSFFSYAAQLLKITNDIDLHVNFIDPDTGTGMSGVAHTMVRHSQSEEEQKNKM